MSLKLDWAFGAELISSLIALFLAILLGSFFCFKTMKTVTIMLPGRGPDFWVWGLGPETKPAQVVDEYMRSLEQAMATNRELNA